MLSRAMFHGFLVELEKMASIASLTPDQKALGGLASIGLLGGGVYAGGSLRDLKEGRGSRQLRDLQTAHQIAAMKGSH